MVSKTAHTSAQYEVFLSLMRTTTGKYEQGMLEAKTVIADMNAVLRGRHASEFVLISHNRISKRNIRRKVFHVNITYKPNFFSFFSFFLIIQNQREQITNFIGGKYSF